MILYSTYEEETNEYCFINREKGECFVVNRKIIKDPLKLRKKIDCIG